MRGEFHALMENTYDFDHVITSDAVEKEVCADRKLSITVTDIIDA
jgi:hypothetical protein